MFSSSFFKIVLLLLLALNVIFCINFVNERAFPQKRLLLEKALAQYREDPTAFRQGYQDLMRYYEESASPSNPFPQDPYRFGGKEFDITDWEIYKDVLQAVDAGPSHEETVADALSQADAIREELINENSFDYRYQSNVIRVYSSLLEKVSFKESLVFSWDLLFSYESEYFPLFLIVILSSAYATLCDKQNGFYAISGTCQKGRNPSVFAKLLSLLVCSFSLVVLFSASTFITIGLSNGGYSSATEAVQAMQEGDSNMIFFPFAMNMWQGYLFSIFFKCLSTGLLAIFVFAIAILTKSIWFSLFAGSGFAVLQYYISEIPASTILSQWKYLGLRSVFSPNGTISRYRAVNIFGFVADLNVVCYMVFAAVFILALLSAFRLYPLSRTNHKVSLYQKISFKGESILFRKRRQRSLSILSFELYKNRFFLVVTIFLVFFKIWSSAAYFQPNQTTYDRFYKEYMDGTIGGNYTEEKAEQIEYETRWYLEIAGRYNEMNEKYHSQSISDEEFIRYLRDYSAAEAKLKVLGELREQAVYLKELHEKKGVVGSFVYDTGYNRLMTQGPDLTLICFVCVLAMQQYLTEFKETNSENSIYTIIQTSKRGRLPLFARKLMICFVTVPTLWLIFKGVDLHFLLNSFDLPNLNVPLISMSAYKDIPSSISILDYLILETVFSLLGTLILSGIAFLIAFLVRKRFLVYALTALTVLIPHFAAKTGVALGNYIDLTMLYDTDRLFRQYKLFGSCLFFALLIFITALGFILARKTVKEGTI